MLASLVSGVSLHAPMQSSASMISRTKAISSRIWMEGTLARVVDDLTSS